MKESTEADQVLSPIQAYVNIYVNMHDQVLSPIQA